MRRNDWQDIPPEDVIYGKFTTAVLWNMLLLSHPRWELSFLKALLDITLIRMGLWQSFQLPSKLKASQLPNTYSRLSGRSRLRISRLPESVMTGDNRLFMWTKLSGGEMALFRSSPFLLRITGKHQRLIHQTNFRCSQCYFCSLKYRKREGG